MAKFSTVNRPSKTRKNIPNKTTAAAKEAIELAAEGLGGAKRLVEWAKEDPANERIFWSQIYTKLLPLQLTGKDGGDLKLKFSWVIESNNVQEAEAP